MECLPGVAVLHISFMRSWQECNVTKLDVFCVAFAAIATYMTWVTGNSIFDAMGSISVGVLLGATAIFLIQRNRQLLIGRTSFRLVQRHHQLG